METKLTLSMEKKIIEQAKKYAKKRNTSLSGLIKNYLLNLTQPEKNQQDQITPLVKDLSGIVPQDMVKDFKHQYAGHLNKKYK
ncbi:MAG: DUF6364 family protein [Bacteroidota bacterium]|nr:DUF6364 family protein [Bacteroidota bacterium]